MRQHLPRIAFVFLIFLLFLAHAAGLFSIRPGSASPPAISTAWNIALELALSPELLLLVAIGLVLSLTLPQLEPIPASILTLCCVVPPVYLHYVGYLDADVLPMEYYLLTILILFVINVLISYYAYSHQRQQIIDTFSHYVHPEVVRKLCRQPGSFSVEGESREMTVLFGDLVNFTSIAEQLDPRQLTLLINHHFEAMSRVLLEHGATIDKYIGDSIMAFWGAPLPQPDHARRAVSAAFAMQAAVTQVTREFEQRGWPAVQLRIGINSGLMNVGNIGSRQRTSYSVIGDAVNVAARLERLTRDYHVAIIVSDTVRRATPDIAYRQLDDVAVKGKQRSTGIYEPLPAYSPDADWLIQHEIALKSYLAQDFATARQQFAALKSSHCDDAYYDFILATIEQRSSEHPISPAERLPSVS